MDPLATRPTRPTRVMLVALGAISALLTLRTPVALACAAPVASPVAAPVASPVASRVASPLASPPASPAGAPVEDRTALAASVLAELHQERFERALELAADLQRTAPADALGHLMEANVRQTRMRNYRLRDDEPHFLDALARAESLGAAAVAERPSAEGHFLLGFARGYRGLHLSRTGDWLGAFKAGRGSVAQMRQALALDPLLADALIPLAAYDYWKGRRLSVLFPEARERAAEKLERAWHGGRLLGVEAAYALETILLLEGEPARALAVNDWLHARFPGNPAGLYHRAQALERLGRRGEALLAWQALEARLRSSARASRGFLAECALARFRLLSAEGRSDEAATALVEALELDHARERAAELDGPLHPAEAVAREIRDASRHAQERGRREARVRHAALAARASR